MQAKYTLPNRENFCGGNFQDWLEVMLTEKCNGKCSWCVEKYGYHPKEHVTWQELTKEILKTKKNNVIFLGGEPTLLPDYLFQISYQLYDEDIDCYLTTNGSMLTASFVENYLPCFTGINISVHSYNLSENYDITGIPLYENILEEAIEEFDICSSECGKVRLNCNLIRGHIDSIDKIYAYIKFAKKLGVDSVRFAELKNDDNHFVNLAQLFDYKYGLNDNPFKDGCHKEATINGMKVSFRQMCGLYTCHRIKPENPKQLAKKVLYYDGKIYDGWQIKESEESEETIEKGETKMTDKELIKVLKDVANKKIDPAEAALMIDRGMRNTSNCNKCESGVRTEKEDLKSVVKKAINEATGSGGCVY